MVRLDQEVHDRVAQLRATVRVPLVTVVSDPAEFFMSFLSSWPIRGNMTGVQSFHAPLDGTSGLPSFSHTVVSISLDD